MSHIYWRIYCPTSASNAISCAEISMASSIGGSNLCTGGTAIASDFFTGFPPSNAFDGNLATEWSSNGKPAWIGYEFASGVSIIEIKWTATAGSNYAQSPTNLFLQFSDDGVNWLNFQQAVTTATWASSNQVQTFDFTAVTWPSRPYVGNGAGTTFNPSDRAGSPNTPTLSGGNLILTGAGSGGASGNGWCRGVQPQRAGKIYFEILYNCNSSVGLEDACGIANGSAVGPDSTGGLGLYGLNGQLIVNVTTVISSSAYLSFTNNCHIGVAVDFINNNIWFSVDGSYWNGSSSANPATNSGGVSISGITGPFYVLGNISGNKTYTETLNAGGSNFDMPVPAGFNAGWPSYAFSGGQIAMLSII